ncbi:glycerophosphoryl diester phosphodiesterase membrane domain-containing protein [Curtobacterium sp. MCLR17_036]|uniref:glycerophosphoryl diester phosphodiesterase membrane domain-containing protein n=1 Tax=Curtobacterium sp. MCLR17_036 TaxID=2175620 RepID=UPI0011B7E17D|nr:glycerophosphoryl diester phosphodiesterase membrane domain-containing protein [Curtobacterium sp. MCLR17_036]WIE63784.1 glycerophosphoryl diester phosphodiesterase membrane domain-containing protein [Curtobacterium sp. MCLR17_036]
MTDWHAPGGEPTPAPGRPGGPRQFSVPLPPAPGPGPRPAGVRPVVPLRPLGFGDVLGGAFTVFRRNARVLLLWSVLLSGVVGLLSTLVSTFGQRAVQSRVFSALDGGSGSSAILAGSTTAWLLLSIGLPFVAYLGRTFLVAPVAADTAQRVLGRRATFGGSWRLLAGRRGSVVAWMFLQIAAALVLVVAYVLVFSGFFAVLGAGDSGIAGFLLGAFAVTTGFGVLIAWLATRFSLTVPTIALEGRRVFDAAGQSWRLTRGAFWRTFGVLLLVQVMFRIAVSIAAVPLTVGASLLSGVFDPLGQTDASAGIGIGATIAVVVGSLLATAVQCITDVLSGSVTTFLAIDRRIRTEALDQRIASHLDTGLPTDPFAPGTGDVRPRPGPQQWTPQQPWAQQQWTPQQPWAQQQPWTPQQAWTPQQPGAQQWPAQQQWPGQGQQQSTPQPPAPAPGHQQGAPQQPWSGQQDASGHPAPGNPPSDGSA